MNGIQKALRGCLPLLLAALLAVQAAALPAGPAAEEYYNYTSNGEPVSAVRSRSFLSICLRQSSRISFSLARVMAT